MMSFVRSSIATFAIASLTLISCSGDKNEPDRIVTREAIVNKTWTTSGVEVVYDSKRYNYSAAADGIDSEFSFNFKENDKVTISNAGDVSEGSWSIENDVLKVKYSDDYILDLNVSALEDGIMTIALANELDPTKNDAMLIPHNYLGYQMAFTLLAQNENIDISKTNKPVSVLLKMKSN